MVNRFLSIIPAVLAAVSFALSIVLLVSGTSPSAAPNFFWLSFDTSSLGQNIIEVSRDGQTPDNGGGSGGGGGIGGTPGDLLDGLRDAFEGVLDGMVDQINGGIQDLQSSILGNLTESLGIRDVYTLHLSRICEGSLAVPDDSSSAVELNRCVPYDDTRQGLRNITESIPSSLTLGGTTISVPLVDALASTLDSVLSLAIHGSRALFALLIISTVMTGTTMLASLAIVPLGHRRFLVRINLVASIIGGTAIFLFAVVMTGLIVGGASVLGELSGAVGLEIKQGGPFLAIGWVAAVLGMGAAWYWFSVWFVSFRLSSFKRRARTGDEIGNWRGITREVLSDLRLRRKA